MDRKSQMLHLAEQMSALEDKKKREAYHLLLFLENFAGFPAGTILPWERPDFLVQTQRECIGIELSQWYFRETTNEHGSRLRAKESAEEKVLQRAASGYERRGLPPVDVFVHWSPSNNPGLIKIDHLAATLIDSVECYLPEQGNNTIIQYPHPGYESLPGEVVSLYIWRPRNITKTRWVPFGATFPPSLTGRDDLQEIVQKKKDNVSHYRQKCSQVWLLIVSNDLELPMVRLSKICNLAPEAKDFRLETTFDRVFFLDCLKRRVVELSTGVGT
jgi:hypothetical protein